MRCSMGIKLFVTDMDGTLLDSNRRISDVNREKIRQAVKDGMLLLGCRLIFSLVLVFRLALLF